MHSYLTIDHVDLILTTAITFSRMHVRACVFSHIAFRYMFVSQSSVATRNWKIPFFSLFVHVSYTEIGLSFILYSLSPSKSAILFVDRHFAKPLFYLLAFQIIAIIFGCVFSILNLYLLFGWLPLFIYLPFMSFSSDGTHYLDVCIICVLCLVLSNRVFI